MTSRGKMLMKLALNIIEKESQEDASCGNSSDSRGKFGYRVKRKLTFSDASNDDILHPAATKQKTDQRETFLVAKNDTTNVAESSKAESSEESLNKASKNIDTGATTEEKANQLDVHATEKTDTKNQAADGETPEVTGIHRSGSKSDESSSSSSSSKSRDGSDSEVFDDTDADRNYNPSSDEESSEDEFQKDIERIVIMAQTHSSNDARKVSKVTETVSTPDVTHSAPSANTVSRSPNLPVTSTPASSSNADPNTPDLHSVASTPASTSNAETSIATTIDILSPVKKGKRKRNQSSWKRNMLKAARNSGKVYESHSKKPEKRFLL